MCVGLILLLSSFSLLSEAAYLFEIFDFYSLKPSSWPIKNKAISHEEKHTVGSNDEHQSIINHALSDQRIMQKSSTPSC